MRMDRAAPGFPSLCRETDVGDTVEYVLAVVVDVQITQTHIQYIYCTVKKRKRKEDPERERERERHGGGYSTVYQEQE